MCLNLLSARHGNKTFEGIKLLVRAPSKVIFRKEYGWPQGHRWLGALCFLPIKKEGQWIMKRLLISSMFLAIIIPSITSAAWWNPFSWEVFGSNQSFAPQENNLLLNTPEKSENVKELQNISNPVIQEKIVTVDNPELQKKINILVAENNDLKSQLLKSNQTIVAYEQVATKLASDRDYAVSVIEKGINNFNALYQQCVGQSYPVPSSIVTPPPSYVPSKLPIGEYCKQFADVGISENECNAKYMKYLSE